jgi:hypothetical protein
MAPHRFTADVRLMYDDTFENLDTHYQSGRELHADYTRGWGLRDRSRSCTRNC